MLVLDILSACHPRDFLPEQSVWNLAPSISTGSVTCRNNVGSCSQETQWQTLCWFCPEQEMIFYTDSAANLKGQTAPTLTAHSIESEILIHRNEWQSCHELGWNFFQSLAILKCIWGTPGLHEVLTLLAEFSCISCGSCHTQAWLWPEKVEGTP